MHTKKKLRRELLNLYNENVTLRDKNRTLIKKKKKLKKYMDVIYKNVQEIYNLVTETRERLPFDFSVEIESKLKAVLDHDLNDQNNNYE